MKLCLTCRAIWRGDPLYCGRCGRSFDARYCQRGHKNPSEAEFCLTCGKADLTTPGPSRDFGMWTLLLAIVVLLVLIRALVYVGPTLLWSLLGVLNHLSGYVFGTPILGCFCPLVMPFVLWWLLIERGRLPSKALKALTTILGGIARFGWFSVRHLALPPKQKEDNKR